ncbi:MAG: glycosyltransferase family 2 protein [Candidatus Paceibacterota bacterium]|jgi:dolichol-phosphate mannosyltransferase
MKQISLIIPTYNEVENIEPLIEEIDKVINKSIADFEYIIVDDNSPDGTGAVAEKLKERYPVKVIHRSGKFGLGSAVIEGFGVSTREYLGVMDADLSHDPDILNNMVKALDECEIVIGSRFAKESNVEQWKWWRKLVSKIGVFFAKLISGAHDPLSGYFILNRSVIDGVQLETVGYKILFEILVKGKWKKIQEFPFTFRIRKYSTSKLNSKEYVLFVKQLLSFAIYKYKSLFRYVVIGGTAFVFDVSSLYVFKELIGMSPVLAVAINQFFILSYIFILNKLWAFDSSKKTGSALIRFFILQLLNYCFGVLWMWIFYEHLGVNYLIARIANIILFAVWNFLLYKNWIFKKN